MTRISLPATWACVLASIAAAADAPRLEKPLVVPASGAETVAAARLDADVYAASSATLSDLRLLDTEGTEVPFRVRTVTDGKRSTVRRTERVEKPAVRLLPGDELEIVVSLDPRKHPVAPAGFVLATPLQDFERRVSVSWAAEGEDWVPLVEDAVVYDYSQFIDVRDAEVVLPAVPARPPGGRYRIVIGDVTQAQQSQLMELTRTLAADREVERQEKLLVNRQPFRIDRIDVWHTEDVVERSIPLLVDRPPSGFRVARDSKARTTRVIVQTRREPLAELAIETSDRNFSRAAVVTPGEGANRDAGPRRDAHATPATLTRIDVAGIKREHLSIAIPETRAAEYEITIDDGDSPPIDVTGVSARGPAQELVFLAKPGATYRLAYGGDLPPPRYDTAAIATALAAGVTPVAATLGAEKTAEGPMPSAAPWHPFADTRVQVAVIAGLAVILAAMLYGAAKRIDATPGDS